MEIINIKNPISDALYNSVLAIGNFDGVHKGHQQIVRQVLEKAQKAKKAAAILTFEPHPISFFSPASHNYRITPFKLKTALLDDYGVDFVTYADFNEEFSKLSAEDFIKTLLCDKLHASEILTGEDFTFGYKRSGNARILAEFGEKYGYKYTAISDIKDGSGKRYSSSLAREYIAEGRVIEAADILGRPYIIAGKVVKGKAEARKLGFPTANIELKDYVIPKYGVYNITADIEGQKVKGVANIGVKPTYGNNEPLLEVHLYNFNADIYGKNISVELNGFIREERKFANLSELQEQIKKDIALSQ